MSSWLIIRSNEVRGKMFQCFLIDGQLPSHWLVNFISLSLMILHWNSIFKYQEVSYEFQKCYTNLCVRRKNYFCKLVCELELKSIGKFHQNLLGYIFISNKYNRCTGFPLWESRFFIYLYVWLKILTVYSNLEGKNQILIRLLCF